MHYVYRPLAARIGEENVNVIFGEKIHNSNQDWDATPNPIYRIIRT